MSEGVMLLDVNVLVALFDPDHVHHEAAHDWFADSRSSGWATCPITENGFLRVLGNPAYGGPVMRVADLLSRLSRFCGSGDHHFWSNTVSFRDESLFNRAFVISHRQLTDIYLLGLATKHGGRLATFDRTVPWKAVVGARPAAVEIIGPAAD